MAFWTTAWPFGSLAPPNMGHISPKADMLDNLIISVGAQPVKRWQRVMLQAPVYSTLAVPILRP